MTQIITKRRYLLFEVASALQKAIRRADARSAGYWGIEIFESGFHEYLWRRLLTISAEDCAGVITQEVKSLYDSWQIINKKRKGAGRIFAAKAIILLSSCNKSRDADHLTNIVYDKKNISDEQIEKDLEGSRKECLQIPEYAIDCHTKLGRIRGKTKKDFFLDEHDALMPKQIGLFDQDLEQIRSGEIKI